MLTLVTALYKSDRYLPGYFSRLYPFVAELKNRGIEFEVIFVPQKPTELEKKLLAEAAKNSWCRIYENPEPSLYMAWNTGVLNAKGDVVGFWNADDWRYVDGTIEAYNLVMAGADVAYSPFRIRRYLQVLGHDVLVHIQRIDKQVPGFNDATYNQFLTGMHCGPFFMFNRKFYDQVGPFDEQFRTVADFDWCLRAAKISKNFKRGKQLIGSFRVDGRGVSAGGRPRHFAEDNIVYLRHGINNKIVDNQTVPGVEELMKDYRANAVKFHGEWQTYSN